MEIPPPPVPKVPSFQAISVGGRLLDVMVVPPAPMTKGCEAGSSTVSWLGVSTQSFEPLSPLAAITVWPWAAACSKIVFSMAVRPRPVWPSQIPQLVEISLSRSSWTILLYPSMTPPVDPVS